MPSTSARPASGRRKPVIILIVVDLPAPLGPRKPRMSPRFTVKLTPSTARLDPYVLTRFLTSIMNGRKRVNCRLASETASPRECSVLEIAAVTARKNLNLVEAVAGVPLGGNR